MTFAFLVFYKVRPLVESDAEKARKQWEEFKRELPKEVRIVGEYDHLWGSVYNGFLLIEAPDLATFHKFWHELRKETRWYIPETQTFIAHKREKAE